MSYKTIYFGGEGEIEEKKSRFIAHIEPVTSEEEAVAFIARIKKQYWDARHNCHAFTIGKNNELQRSSDDGEPSGTAGRPMLDVLLKEEIHDCVVVVTRYFGGTLLGTGGLVRAYQKATQEGLANCTIIEKQTGFPITISTDYTGLGKVQYIIAQNQIPTTNTRYTDAVEIDVVVSELEKEHFIKAITEGTNGKAIMETGDPVIYAMIDGRIELFTEDFQ